MSTYYFLVCDHCQERCDAASVNLGGAGMLGNSFLLPRFLQRHANVRCMGGVRLTNEHEVAAQSYEEFGNGIEDPRREAENREAELLDRAHRAEANVRKLIKLYGGT